MSYTIPINVLKQESGKIAYERGMKVYQREQVVNLQAREQNGEVAVQADVASSKGNGNYSVTLLYNPEEKQMAGAYCDCMAFVTYEGICKHCVAAALKYNRMVNEGKFGFARQTGHIQTSDLLQSVMRQQHSRVLERYRNQMQQVLPGPVELVPVLACNDYTHQWSVHFQIGTPEKYYVMKDLTAFAERVENEEFFSYGKKLEFMHTRQAFAQHSRAMLDLVLESIGQEQSLRQKQMGHFYQTLGQTKRDLPLTVSNLFRLLHSLPASQVQVEQTKGHVVSYRVLDAREPVYLPIALQAEPDGGYTVTMPAMQHMNDGTEGCVICDGTIRFYPPEQTDAMELLAQLVSNGRETVHYVAEQDLNIFCATLLPALKQCAHLDTTGLEQYLPEQCRLRVYLDDDGMNILCQAEAWYGGKKFILTEQGSQETVRNLDMEFQLSMLLEQYFPLRNSYGEYYFSGQEDGRLYELLTEGIRAISGMAEVYLSDRMKHIQIQPQPKLQIGVSVTAGLLDIDIDAERLPQDELQALLNNYRMRRRYYRMRNGNFLQLEAGSLATLAELADGLHATGRMLRDGHLQAPMYQAYYVDKVLQDGGEDLTVQRNLNFRSLVRNLKNYEDSDDEIPETLQTTLRQYQKVGYRWLMTLQRMGLGGILADDMGLGKTVEIITMLLANRMQLLEKPALVITPASLVFNWESEIRRFAPSLTVRSITGSAAERQELLQQEPVQVILTSYDLLKRDIEIYETMQFSYCIIDEAQNIKNHSTKAAKTVKRIQADTRFALTGTPIENRLSELWSIFDFLLPGMLGSYELFRKQYETAIVQHQDEIALARLHRMIKPFILRRLKQDVLKDLPEKIETTVYSRMEAPQRELYMANLQRVLDGLQQKSEAEVHTQKLQILAELMHLRQICCDPSLLYDNYHGESAKLETCMELIEDAVQGGSKILVFSQFTTMLDRIEQRLQQMQIRSLVLTGSTGREQRADLVHRFNTTDEAQVFLISLKAGGTGLNLTAASVVIHVDPWWNAAAQEQATDRAHRIGQKQAVTVLKLITKDTIEEKIQELQAKKLALTDSVLGAAGMSMASLNREELISILQTV